MSLLLVLHGVRLAGMADDDAVARRFGLPPAQVAGMLRDASDRGWVQHAEFAGTAGWWLTDVGRAENERLLAAELDAVPGGRAAVVGVHEDFLPLNARLQKAVTDWQLRPVEGRLAPNDHTDDRWDDAVLDELAVLCRELAPLTARLTAALDRFDGYDTRFARALARAWRGEHQWVDRSDVDSCHRTWFELHEDLLATLGIDRATTPPR